MNGNAYATFDEDTGYTTEANIHIGGTIPRGTSLDFWMTRPRPKGISLDEWEALEEAKWSRIFGSKKGRGN